MRSECKHRITINDERAEQVLIRLYIIVSVLRLANLRQTRLKRPNYLDLLRARSRYGDVFGLELNISIEVLP